MRNKKNYNLNGIKMHVVKTAEKGVVNQDTFFKFQQKNHKVFSAYAGGQILRGVLVGALHGSRLKFRYGQVEVNGRMDFGNSECYLEETRNKTLRLIEKFQWKTRPGITGINIFEESK